MRKEGVTARLTMGGMALRDEGAEASKVTLDIEVTRRSSRKTENESVREGASRPI